MLHYLFNTKFLPFCFLLYAKLILLINQNSFIFIFIILIKVFNKGLILILRVVRILIVMDQY